MTDKERAAALADEPHESAMHGMLHLAVQMIKLLRIKSPAAAEKIGAEVDRIYMDWRDKVTALRAFSPPPADASTIDEAKFKEAMAAPHIVHLHMLRGAIAKPTPDQIRHLYPEMFAPPPADVREALEDAIKTTIAEPVNATPETWAAQVGRAANAALSALQAAGWGPLADTTSFDWKAFVVSWAVERWRAEVQNRPLVNIHRRALDNSWRQVMRHFGGDPDALVGPSHDDLVAANPKSAEHETVETPAARDVLAERRRQAEEEGWTAEHDDAHDEEQMAMAAAVYACPKWYRDWLAQNDVVMWPWEPEHWKPTDRRRDLVKAGALILAEIERIDRKGGA